MPRILCLKGENMVTITDGVKIFRVTAGAAKTYEGMGFHVMSDEELEETRQMKSKPMEDKIPHNVNVESREIKDESDVADTANNEDAAFIEELLEKPLSQWSNEELKEFVKIKDIDTSGAQKVSQVRGIVKAYLEEEQKKNV